MRRAVTWLDVFTSTPLTGNQLAVVHDADDLSDATMHAYARETRLSETTFVQTPSAAGADYRNRIWSMGGEMPFAGHPSLGTAVAVARARGVSEARYTQQTPAGLQPVQVVVDGDLAHASMHQEPATFGALPDAAAVMAAAGLTDADAHDELPPQVVGTGAAHLIAVLNDPAALARVAPTATGLRALIAPLGATVLYLAAVDLASGSAQARGFFLDPVNLLEDPATGSAAGPLLAYLHQRSGIEKLSIAQGVEMGRPSAIACDWDRDRVRVAGDVVVIGDGQVSL